MKKALVLVCVIGVSCIIMSVSAAASSMSDTRSPVDGGYIQCPDDSLISELGIKFQHSSFPGKPTVFHIVPSEVGRSFGKELLEAITPTTKPSTRTKWLSGLAFLPGIGTVAGPAAGISYFFDIRSSRESNFDQYIVDFYDCLKTHPVWLAHLYPVILFGQLSDLGVKSWHSIEMQLLCHAAGSALPMPGTNLGGTTWDLEGHVGEPYPSIDPFDLVLTSACQWDSSPFSWIPVPWG